MIDFLVCVIWLYLWLVIVIDGDVVTSNDGCVMMMLKGVVGGNGVLW